MHNRYTYDNGRVHHMSLHLVDLCLYMTEYRDERDKKFLRFTIDFHYKKKVKSKIYNRLKYINNPHK